MGRTFWAFFPCALWCSLAFPDDFEQSLFTAVDADHDADTVSPPWRVPYLGRATVTLTCRSGSVTTWSTTTDW